MNTKQMQTHIKNNKRQIMEQTAIFDETEASLIQKINAVTMVPTNTVVDVSLTVNTASGKTFTAPFNGYFFLSIYNGTSTALFYLVNNTTGFLSSGIDVPASKTFLCYIPCKKGDSIGYFRNAKPSNIWWARFIKGGTV